MRKFFVMVCLVTLLVSFLSAWEGDAPTVMKESVTYTVESMDFVYSPEGETMGMSVVGVDADGGKVMFLDNTNYIDVGDKVLVTYEAGTYGEVILAVQEVGKRD